MNVTINAFSYKGYMKKFEKDVNKKNIFCLLKQIKESCENDIEFGDLKTIYIKPCFGQCFDNIAEIKIEFF